MPEQQHHGRVLIYSGPDDNAEFYNSISAILTKILDQKKYEIRQLKHEAIITGPTSSWATGTVAVIVNNDGGEKKFDTRVQQAFLEYFVNSGKVVFLCNAADGRQALWLLKTAASAEQGAPFSDNVGLAFEKFAQNQPIPANLQSFQVHKAADPDKGNVVDYAVGLVRGDSDLSYMYFVCEDGDTAVFVVSKATLGSGADTSPDKSQAKTESFWKDILRVLRLIGVEVLPISPAQAAQNWAGTATAGGGEPAVSSPPVENVAERILVYLGPGEEDASIKHFQDLQSTLKRLIGDQQKYDIQLLKHEQFAQPDSNWRKNCHVLFVDNRDWERRFDESTKKVLTTYFAESGKVVFFCDRNEGRKAMWLLKSACAPNEDWPDAVGTAYERFAQDQPVPTDVQAIQTQKKGSEQLTDLSLGLIKGANGAFTYLKCEDGDTAVFVAMTLDDVLKRGSFIWSELLRVVGLPMVTSQMPAASWGSTPVVGDLTRVVKYINTGAASLVGGIQERVSKFLKGDSKAPVMKPPNLLVYVNGEGNEAVKKFQAFSTALRSFLMPDRYTVYPLKKDQIIGDQRAPWTTNCMVLFVENEKLNDEGVRKALADYFLHYTGRLIMFSNPTDGREALWLLNKAASGEKWPEIIGETYERFIRTGERVIPTEVGKFSSSGGSDEECCVNLLGGFRGSPPILHFTTGHGVAGKEEKGPSAVFVGAPFERICVEKGEETWADILGAAGLETAKSTQSTQLEAAAIPAAGVFFRNEELAASVKALHPTGQIELPTVKARIGEQPSTEPNLLLNIDEYFQYLKTKRLGQVVVYAPVVSSTMHISDDWHNTFGVDDYVVITKQQSQGQGRSGNQWLSPLGSALFTFCVHVPQKTLLGKHLSFLQHLGTLAVADSIHQLHEALNIRIKWPNDIYYGKELAGLTKVGGVLVKANVVNEKFAVFLGTGVNVSNPAPTVCLNDFLPSGTKPLTSESVMAITLTRLEQLIDVFQQKGAAAILPLYYKYWLHSNQEVTVAATGEKVTILGLDDYGFLQVKTIGSGRTFTLHPDGNSFDMMTNLIERKDTSN